MKPKIIYWLDRPNHKRIFVPFKNDPRVEQLIITHNVSNSGLNIASIKTANVKSACNFIDKFKPDVFVQCDEMKKFRHEIKRIGAKHAYINHGIWPHSPNNIARVKDPWWNEFDMLFGGTIMFKELFDKYSLNKSQVFIDTLPQFDNVFKNKKIRENIRESLFKKGNPGVKKIITLFSHDCKNRISINPFNEGFYKTAVELGRLAKKYHWLVFIKLKKKDVNSYLANNKAPWAIELKKDYFNLKQNPNIKFIGPDEAHYSYLCGDVVIVSARSTIEIEASLMQVPLIKIEALGHNPNYDHREQYEVRTKDYNAAYLINNIDHLEGSIHKSLNNDNTILFNNQKIFTDAMGITLDGLAHKRIIDVICKIYGE